MRIASMIATVLSLIAFAANALQAAEPATPLADIQRIVFLGDSITYAGHYIEFVEACLRVQNPNLRCEFLNMGLPSETVSGLSEPGHAGGQFPRPDLHERLGRVLEQSHPNLLVVCYGMNDGIYYPFDVDRFAKFQNGIKFVREKAVAAGAKVLHLTPPVFDPQPIKARTLPAGLAEYRQPYEGYNDVLDRYSDWLIAQKTQGWDVVDIHTPLRRVLSEKRKADPSFVLAGDGVHMNTFGHWIIARELLKHWETPPQAIDRATGPEAILSEHPQGTEILSLVQKKQRIRKDAWLTAVGHKRPGMAKGLPRAQADAQAKQLELQIQAKLEKKP